MDVFLLGHVRHALNLDGSVEHVDSSGEIIWDEEEGDDLERAELLPGFADEPDCFMIGRFTLDKDLWTDGFVTIPRPD